MAQSQSSGGAIILGIFGIGLGAFVVNYAFADEGESWYDQIARKLKGEGGDGGLAFGHHREPRRLSSGADGAVHPSHPTHLVHPSQPIGSVPFSPAPPASPDLIREVQARLNSFGFPSFAGVRKLPLQIDGLLGPDTRAMLAGMQHQWQMPATGYPDPETVRVLRSMTSGAKASPPVARLAAPARRAGTRRASPQAQAQVQAQAQASQGSVTPLGQLPPEAVGEIAMMLDDVFHLGLSEHMKQAGKIPALQEVQGLLASFQQQAGIPVTGQLDDATYRKLVDAANAASAQAAASDPHHHVSGDYYVGASGWEDEVSSLGQEAHDVIAHAISSETNSRRLSSLSHALGAAGFSQAAAAVSAKAGGAGTATSGWW